MRRLRRQKTASSDDYWRRRYASGGTSGDGLKGELARYKAEFLNRFVADNAVRSVIEWGCGDGQQLGLAEYPQYVGIDVSADALALCRATFDGDPTKAFEMLGETAGLTADLALSLDVVYHLFEDEVFYAHMTALFASAERFVVVYSSNHDAPQTESHVRHRRFTDWVDSNRSDWNLIRHEQNPMPFRGDTATGSGADFFVFARRDADQMVRGD